MKKGSDLGDKVCDIPDRKCFCIIEVQQKFGADNPVERYIGLPIVNNNHQVSLSPFSKKIPKSYDENFNFGLIFKTQILFRNSLEIKIIPLKEYFSK